MKSNAHNKTTQINPGLVASYDIRPGHRSGLFYIAPEPARGYISLAYGRNSQQPISSRLTSHYFTACILSRNLSASTEAFFCLYELISCRHVSSHSSSCRFPDKKPTFLCTHISKVQASFHGRGTEGKSSPPLLDWGTAFTPATFDSYHICKII